MTRACRGMTLKYTGAACSFRENAPAPVLARFSLLTRQVASRITSLHSGSAGRRLLLKFDSWPRSDRCAWNSVTGPPNAARRSEEAAMRLLQLLAISVLAAVPGCA